MKQHDVHAQSCLTLCDPMDSRPPAPLFMGFPRQEYWSGLPFPPPGVLNPKIKSVSCIAGGFFTTEPPGKNSVDIAIIPFNRHPLSTGYFFSYFIEVWFIYNVVEQKLAQRDSVIHIYIFFFIIFFIMVYLRMFNILLCAML